MNINKYPHELSRGNNNVVVALNKTQVGKIFTPDSRVEVTTEARNMQYANKINDLVVKFFRIDIDGDNQILVMERLSILEPRSIEKEIREIIYSDFISKLNELHKHGFCHRNIKRPSGFGGRAYDNVILTEEGLRLIDTGISAIRDNSNEILFTKYVEAEIKEADEFFEYFIEQ
jgi:serine/threonine protein kinase